MAWFWLIISAVFVRAGEVVSIEDASALRIVRPYLGEYVSEEDDARVSVTYDRGIFLIIENGEVTGRRRIAGFPRDLLVESVERDGWTSFLGGNPALLRSCEVDGHRLHFNEIRTTWFKKITERCDLALAGNYLDVRWEKVLDRRVLPVLGWDSSRSCTNRRQYRLIRLTRPRGFAVAPARRAPVAGSSVLPFTKLRRKDGSSDR